jgi:hypothetical protein
VVEHLTRAHRILKDTTCKSTIPHLSLTLRNKITLILRNPELQDRQRIRDSQKRDRWEYPKENDQRKDLGTDTQGHSQRDSENREKIARDKTARQTDSRSPEAISNSTAGFERQRRSPTHMRTHTHI